MIGISDGLETDSNGLIYTGNFEQNAINIFDPASGMTRVFVRDPRIGWTDSMFVAADGYVYFTENQLWRTPGHFPGTERRVRPFGLLERGCLMVGLRFSCCSGRISIVRLGGFPYFPLHALP